MDFPCVSQGILCPPKIWSEICGSGIRNNGGPDFRCVHFMYRWASSVLCDLVHELSDKESTLAFPGGLSIVLTCKTPFSSFSARDLQAAVLTNQPASRSSGAPGKSQHAGNRDQHGTRYFLHYGHSAQTIFSCDGGFSHTCIERGGKPFQ